MGSTVTKLMPIMVNAKATADGIRDRRSGDSN